MQSSMDNKASPSWRLSSGQVHEGPLPCPGPALPALLCPALKVIHLMCSLSQKILNLEVSRQLMVRINGSLCRSSQTNRCNHTKLIIVGCLTCKRKRRMEQCVLFWKETVAVALPFDAAWNCSLIFPCAVASAVN